MLYGVTMEEAGVAKLVAVRLARRERETGVHADLIGTANPAAGSDEGPSIAESFGKSEQLHSAGSVSSQKTVRVQP